MFNRIMLAADGSEYSLKAAEKAIYLAKANPESKITVVHVVDELPSRSDVMDAEFQPRDIPEHRKAQIENVKNILKDSGVNFDVRHIFGDPGPALVGESLDMNADLILIGSRGLNTFQQMVLGSVSHKVAKRAKCPVMIVKE
ncbi:universal stress protein [Salisediminibacterium beveridgei]|uniref:Universal stress protein family n=1 Tax=Salisediminibacterium beveridgei TaxID=632773 RepID=A0A1D7QVI3_9BACI|nr:universal stress protein [Salisediminibacterium beveridgei]AOM83026.1 Universal stress protein family [Salisediminibacterium beveridgei]